MAGYRYSNDERTLLIKIVKKAVEDFDATVKSAIKKNDEVTAYAFMRQCDVARSALAKLEGIAEA